MRGAWPSADAPSPIEMLTLSAIQAQWGRWYHIEYIPGGKYRATRPDGKVLPEADSPEGLRFAIMADHARWGTR